MPRSGFAAFLRRVSSPVRIPDSRNIGQKTIVRGGKARKVSPVTPVQRAYVSSSYRYVHLDTRRERERRGGCDDASGARYRSQVHASEQLRTLARWILDAINSADIKRDGGGARRGEERRRERERALGAK